MLTSTNAVLTLDPITKADGLRSGTMMTPQGFASLILAHDAAVERAGATLHETIIRDMLSMGHKPALDCLSTTVSKAHAVFKAFESGGEMPADTLGCVNKANAASVRSTASTYKSIVGAIYCGLMDADFAIAAGKAEAYRIAGEMLREEGLRPDGTQKADADEKRHAAAVRKAAKEAGFTFDASMTPEEFAEAKAKAEALVADEIAKKDFERRMEKAQKLIDGLMEVIGDNATLRDAVIAKIKGEKPEPAMF